jgi:hypothetical protein
VPSEFALRESAPGGVDKGEGEERLVSLGEGGVGKAREAKLNDAVYDLCRERRKGRWS